MAGAFYLHEDVLQNKTENRVEEIDILRGMAIFLVILGHAIIVYPINLQNIQWCKSLHDIIYSFHMELLFLISGWCFKNSGNIKHYITKKIKRLIIPYVFFSMADYLARFLFSSYVNRTGMDWKYILLYGGNYWFIYTLFIICILYYVIDNVPNLWIKTSFILLLFMTSGYFPELLCLKFVFRYMLFYHMGHLFRSYEVIEKLRRLKDGYKFIMTMGCFVFFTCCLLWPLTVNVFDSFVTPVFATGFVIGLVSIDRIRKMFVFLAHIGVMTLPIYLFEGFWLTISRTLIVRVSGITNPAIIITSNVFFDLFISFAIITYASCKSRWFRFAVGME